MPSMDNFTINVPAETLQAKPRTIVRTGFYCDICNESWHEGYAHKDVDGSWHVPATGGGFYMVAKDLGGNWHCDCAGFEYRGRCRHLHGTEHHVGVIELESLSKKHSLPHTTHIRYEQARWPSDTTLDTY
jgi:hypothetical protein